MQFDALIWVLLPLFIAAGSSLLSFYIMSARMEVAVAKEREALAETKATLKAQDATTVERVKAAEGGQTSKEAGQEREREDRALVRDNAPPSAR